MSVPELLADDPFARRLGVRLIVAEPERVVIEMDLEPHHLDGSGRVASGVIFALADCAMSLISNRTGRAVAVATYLTRSESEPGPGTLRAEISETSRQGQATTWTADVSVGEISVGTFVGTTLG